jgi:chlorobactene glucosyltransferase
VGGVIPAPWLAALPWLLWPVLAVLRIRLGDSLDEVSASPPSAPPLLSIIVPARNEERTIASCVRSILASSYPALELLVVNDHSTDATVRVALDAAGNDPRVRVLDAPPLADGWFGKQWACAHGAAAARGAVLCFTDADTTHGPELHTRAVNALRARKADLLSVAGAQEMRSFWERVVQPHVIAMLLLRFGGTAGVNRSTRAADKVANGQFLVFRRAAYDAVGGHAAVRAKVAEDLALAQRTFALGYTYRLLMGVDHLSTRMYASLGALVRGWRKNIYAGALDAMPGGTAGRAVLPALLLVMPLFGLAPVAGLLLGAAGAAWGGDHALLIATVTPRAAVTWGAIASGALVVWWMAVYVGVRVRVGYALLFPLASAVVLYIVLGALARGRRVEWKGRAYRAG